MKGQWLAKFTRYGTSEIMNILEYVIPLQTCGSCLVRKPLYVLNAKVQIFMKSFDSSLLLTISLTCSWLTVIRAARMGFSPSGSDSRCSLWCSIRTVSFVFWGSGGSYGAMGTSCHQALRSTPIRSVLSICLLLTGSKLPSWKINSRDHCQV